MNRKNPVSGYGDNLVIVEAILVGGGDGEDLDIPTDLATKRINAASSGARSDEGVYDIVLAEGSVPPQVNQVIPHCEGADAYHAAVTAEYDSATRTVEVTTTLADSSAAGDLPATSKLKLLIVGRDSTS